MSAFGSQYCGNRRSWIRSIGLFVFLLSILAFFRDELNPTSLQQDHFVDFLEYYAGAKLFMSGGNPYSAAELFIVQQGYQNITTPIQLWNPPFVFAFIFWLPLLPFATAQWIWVALISSTVVFAGHSLWFGHTLVKPKLWIFLLFLLSWFPIIDCIHFAQISFLFLLSTAVFFADLKEAESPTSSFRLGLFLSVLLLKPHSFALFFLGLALESLRTRKFQTLCGLFSGAVSLAIFALLIHPYIFEQYWFAIHTLPIHFQTPTVGSWLQGFTGRHELLVRLFPTLLLAVALSCGWMFWKNVRFRREELLFLLSVSLLFSPYSWLFDSVALLPVAFWILTPPKSQTIGSVLPILLLSANFLLLFGPKQGEQTSLWYLLVFTVAATLRYWQYRNQPSPAARPSPASLDSSPK